MAVILNLSMLPQRYCVHESKTGLKMQKSMDYERIVIHTGALCIHLTNRIY